MANPRVHALSPALSVAEIRSQLGPWIADVDWESLNTEPRDEFITSTEISRALTFQASRVVHPFFAQGLLSPLGEKFIRVFAELNSAQQVQLLLGLSSQQQKTLLVSLYNSRRDDPLRDLQYLFVALSKVEQGLLGGHWLGLLEEAHAGLARQLTDYILRMNYGVHSLRVSQHLQVAQAYLPSHGRLNRGENVGLAYYPTMLQAQEALEALGLRLAMSNFTAIGYGLQFVKAPATRPVMVVRFGGDPVVYVAEARSGYKPPPDAVDLTPLAEALEVSSLCGNFNFSEPDLKAVDTAGLYAMAQETEMYQLGGWEYRQFKIYREILSRNPTEPRALLKVARMCSRTGLLPLGRECLRSALHFLGRRATPIVQDLQLDNLYREAQALALQWDLPK